MLLVSILGPGDPVVSLKHFPTFFMALIWRKYRDKAGMLLGKSVESSHLNISFFFQFALIYFRKLSKLGSIYLPEYFYKKAGGD